MDPFAPQPQQQQPSWPGMPPQQQQQQQAPPPAYQQQPAYGQMGANPPVYGQQQQQQPPQAPPPAFYGGQPQQQQAPPPPAAYYGSAPPMQQPQQPSYPPQQVYPGQQPAPYYAGAGQPAAAPAASFAGVPPPQTSMVVAPQQQQPYYAAPPAAAPPAYPVATAMDPFAAPPAAVVVTPAAPAATPPPAQGQVAVDLFGDPIPQAPPAPEPTTAMVEENYTAPVGENDPQQFQQQQQEQLYGIVLPSEVMPFNYVSGFPREKDMASLVLSIPEPCPPEKIVAAPLLPRLMKPDRLLKFSMEHDKKKKLLSRHDSFSFMDPSGNPFLGGIKALEEHSKVGRSNRIVFHEANGQPVSSQQCIFGWILFFLPHNLDSYGISCLLYFFYPVPLGPSKA